MAFLNAVADLPKDSIVRLVGKVLCLSDDFVDLEPDALLDELCTLLNLLSTLSGYSRIRPSLYQAGYHVRLHGVVSLLCSWRMSEMEAWSLSGRRS